MSLEISVIIPVYNAAAFLRKAVASALQFDEVKEIILAEDKSSDDSLLICKNLASENSKIKLYQHPDKKNHGAAATRNLGLEKAESAFIAFLDADDYYLPNRFEAERNIFEDSKVDGVFGAIGIEYLTQKGKVEFQEKFKDISLTTVNFAAEGHEVFRGLLGLSTKVFGTFFHLNSLTVKKSVITKNNVRFNENLRVHQDSDFIIKLAYYCHLQSGIIDRPIAIRGVHDDNRITKIARYSSAYNQRQFLLWNSLHDWSENENISADAKENIYLKFKSFDLSLKKVPGKYFEIIFEALKNHKILKTQYRFTYLNR